MSASSRPQPPIRSRLRFTALVALGVYPVVTLLLYAVLSVTPGWATWQRTLIVAPLMVVIVVWVLIPTINRRFGRWLAA
ncbi:hypothetical protein [Azospirillum thermophilum]|uniref:DUF2842 domain-containing protein n=1 Tax=Azospirillum thermophilum TaxID=2202148 RepID=A0A2S2CUM3_9PROT|nr:hypothetical protein [Azospirillum thermophilum]AWK88169.1 hypothetical protein DEW08_18785 [Azospirillum thermophilum]